MENKKCKGGAGKSQCAKLSKLFFGTIWIYGLFWSGSGGGEVGADVISEDRVTVGRSLEDGAWRCHKGVDFGRWCLVTLYRKIA